MGDLGLYQTTAIDKPRSIQKITDEQMRTMTTAKMMTVVMFMLEQLLAQAIATALAYRLPDYECGAHMDALTSPPNEPCQNTTARSALLTLCFLFLNQSSRLPSAECCAAVLEVWPLYPACFCFLTFFPPMVPDGGDRSAFHARPLLCNLTADLCGVCPTLLFPSSNRGTRSRKIESLVLGISISAAIILFLAGLLSIGYWRSKKIARFYEMRKFSQHFNDIEGKPTIFPYGVLKVSTKNFDPNNKIGEGGFGSVFKGVLPDGTEVAVKQLSAKSQQGNDEFLNEVTLITSVQHRNLVKLRGCCLKGQERLLVYEFLENRSLHQAMFDVNRTLQLDWKTRVKILQGTACGLAYLHGGCHTRIVHRDIKASNILLDKDLNPKIADFGLARIFSENDTHVSTRVAGTAGYLAPEYAMRGQLTEKADVFSFGVVALELVSGRPNLVLHLPPHVAYLLDWTWHLYEDNMILSVLDPTIRWSKEMVEESLRVIELALLCTHSRPNLRPTMTAIMSILTGGSEVKIPKLDKLDVRNYADLDLNSLNTSSDRIHSAALQPSAAYAYEPSSRSDQSIVSALEPR